MSEIRDFIFNEPVFDTHEHLFGFANMNGQKDTMLYKEVMESYATTSVITSHGSPLHPEINEQLGKPEGFYDVFGFMRNEGLDEYLFDQWKYVRTTGYGEGIELGVKESFGIDFTYENRDRLTEAFREEIRRHGTEGLYKRLLGQAGVIGIVNSAYWVPLMNADIYNAGDFPACLRHTIDPGLLYEMHSKDVLNHFEPILNRSIHTLKELDEGLNDKVSEGFASGMVCGHKIGVAYQRPLDIGPYDPVAAEKIFDRIMKGENVAEIKPLSDYFIHRSIQRSADANKPIQVHTGLLAGSYSKVTQGDPEAMIETLRTYRNARFDVFHSSWPHTGTLGAIAKSFPNVWINMCWAWTISPEGMERALSEWLGEVPYNKIFAFGGDTSTPINTVGYAVQMRRGLANVLESKIERGVYDLATARDIAQALLWRNAREFWEFGDLPA